MLGRPSRLLSHTDTRDIPPLTSLCATATGKLGLQRFVLLLEHLVLGRQVNRVRLKAARVRLKASRVRSAPLELLEERRRRGRRVEKRLSVLPLLLLEVPIILYYKPFKSKVYTTTSEHSGFPKKAQLYLRVSFARRLEHRAPTRHSIPKIEQRQPS